MVFTNNGKNKIRDLMDASLSYGVMGVGTAEELSSDSALSSADTSTSAVITTQTADKQIVVDFNLPSTTGNGLNISEYGNFSTDDVMYSRHLFSSLTKSSTDQWQLSIIYRIN